jgi:hypothetical protein
MAIHFIRNIQFTRLIKVDGRLKEFNFRKLMNQGDERCSVDTVDERGNRIIFSVSKENGSWKLASALIPGWIVDYEKQLHDAIEEELASRQ